MKTRICIVFLYLILIASCKKESNPRNSPTDTNIFGCTDSAALNYSDSANRDNGGCTYFADIFNGNYLAYDSSFSSSSIYPPGPPSADTFHFILQRMRSDTVRMCNYVCDYDTVYFKADSSYLDFSGPFCIVWGSYHFKLSNDTIYYGSYASGQGYYPDITHRGYAIRQ